MDINIYHHFPTDKHDNSLIKEILHYSIIHQQKLNEMVQTLDQVLQSVQDESALDDSIITLVTGLKQQVADALSGANLPPSVQSKVDAIFSAVEANKAKVAAAVNAGTTTTPPDTTTPPTDTPAPPVDEPTDGTIPQ